MLLDRLIDDHRRLTTHTQHINSYQSHQLIITGDDYYNFS